MKIFINYVWDVASSIISLVFSCCLVEHLVSHFAALLLVLAEVDLGLLYVLTSLYIGVPWPYSALNQPLAARVVDATQYYYVAFLVD